MYNNKYLDQVRQIAVFIIHARNSPHRSAGSFLALYKKEYFYEPNFKMF